MTFARAFIFVCGAASGVLLYDVAIERQTPLPRWVNPCPPANIAGEALAYSITQDTYIKGKPRPHECYYK